MYAVTVHFDAVSGRAEALERALLVQAETSLREEAECLRFDVAKDPANDCRFLLYELYENEAAFESHLKSAHFLSFNEKTAELVANRNIERWVMLRGTS